MSLTLTRPELELPRRDTDSDSEGTHEFVRTATAICGMSDTSDFICDGVADDVSINAMLAWLNSLGGGVGNISALPATHDNYDITAHIDIYDNIILEGSGPNSTLKLADNADDYVIVPYNWPGSGNNYFIIRNIEINGNGSNQTALTTIGINIVYSSYFIIENCIVHDTYYDNIGCWYSSHDGIFRNNLCYNTFRIIREMIFLQSL